MTAPRHKSRSNKRVKVKLPGGETVTHFRAKKPGKHVCGRCSKPLSGMPNMIPSRLARISKTERVPERPYAGVLCTECSEALFRYKARFEAKAKNPEYAALEVRRDLTLEKFLSRTWWDSINKKK
jgi:large subunit ribosomal protein L34e